jgi:hypothetical protein
VTDAGYKAAGIAVGDVSGDGLDDLAIAVPADGAELFFAQGDGGFIEVADLYGPEVFSVALGNFSPDGGPALAAAVEVFPSTYYLYVWPLVLDGGVADEGCPNTSCLGTCSGAQEYWGGECPDDLIGQPFLAALPMTGAQDAVVATTSTRARPRTTTCRCSSRVTKTRP